MKRFLASLIAIVGAGLTLYSAYELLVAGGTIYGYHPMYPGLLGLAMLSAGILTYQE